MKKIYLLEKEDFRKIRKMLRLVEKAIVEIIKLKEIKKPNLDPFPPAQTDVIEETWFVEQQLSLFNKIQENSDSIEF